MKAFFYSWFSGFSLLVLFSLLCSCSSLDHGPLIEQELRFRPGFEGLTHATCFELIGDDCLRQDVIEYKFSNESDLKRLKAVQLICKVGDRRFHICEDEAALCSNFEEIKTFLGVPYSTTLQSEKLHIPDDVQTLIDANTYCAAQGSVSEKGMF